VITPHAAHNLAQRHLLQAAIGVLVQSQLLLHILEGQQADRLLRQAKRTGQPLVERPAPCLIPFFARLSLRSNARIFAHSAILFRIAAAGTPHTWKQAPRSDRFGILYCRLL